MHMHAWKGTTHLLFRGGYKSYYVRYFRLTSVFLFQMLDYVYVSCMHWPKGWDVWIFFVFLAITLKVEDLADGRTPVNLDRSKNGDGFRDKEAMTEAAMLHEWLWIGLFLLLSVSLSFLANLFAGSSCFKYSNREVRGSNKWLSLVWQVSVAAWCRGPMARCCSAVRSVFHSLSFTWLTEDGRIWRKHLAGEWIVLRTFLLLLYPLIEIYLFLCESVFLIAFFSEYLCYWINFLCSFQHFTVSSSITTS